MPRMSEHINSIMYNYSEPHSRTELSSIIRVSAPHRLVHKLSCDVNGHLILYKGKPISMIIPERNTSCHCFKDTKTFLKSVPSLSRKILISIIYPA